MQLLSLRQAVPLTQALLGKRTAMLKRPGHAFGPAVPQEACAILVQRAGQPRALFARALDQKVDEARAQHHAHLQPHTASQTVSQTVSQLVSERMSYHAHLQPHSRCTSHGLQHTRDMPHSAFSSHGGVLSVGRV